MYRLLTYSLLDCRRKISPTGDGKFRSHVDMTKFNRLGKEKSEESIFEYNEIFGIYRRNNDDMHIIFSTEGYSDRANIRLSMNCIHFVMFISIFKIKLPIDNL